MRAMTTDSMNSAVAAEIRAERAAQRLTTRELATRAGLDHRTMLRYMNDERPINVDRLARFAHGLGMTPQDLLTRALARMADLDQREILAAASSAAVADEVLAARAALKAEQDSEGEATAHVR